MAAIILSALGLTGLLGLGVATAVQRSRARELEERLQVVEVALAELGVLPAEVVGIIDRIETKLKEHDVKLDELRSDLDSLASRLEEVASTLENRISDLSDRLSGLESQVESHKGEIRSLREAVSGEIRSLGDKFYDIAALLKTDPFVRHIPAFTAVADKFESIAQEFRVMADKVRPGTVGFEFACQICGYMVYPESSRATCSHCGSVYEYEE